MKLKQLLNFKSLFVSLFFTGSLSLVSAQTNVYDDVIAMSPDHTYLVAAIQQEGLESALQDNNATLTVFAPTNEAFDSLAARLNTDINGLLALPNLDDVLLYHVLGSTVDASAVTNGAVVAPLSPTNTVKLTKTSGGSVYVNHAMVTQADLTADNGVVHVTNEVVLPVETVADIAIDNNFSTLVTAVATSELLPVVTNPFVSLTVFAPTNQAFDNLAVALNTDVNGLLALPNLADVLTYHVLDVEVASSSVTNGGIVQPVSPTNTLKTTVTGGGDVFVNQAQVTAVDLGADNGIVHVLDAVVLPVETVVDVAIDNNFSVLTQAVVTAELLPALTDPLADYTVFAPSDQAFNDFAAELNTDINGLLALSNLQDVLLYHVIDGSLLAADLSDGNLTTLNTEDVVVSIGMDVMINDATVQSADVTTDNGVVHSVDRVLNPAEASLNKLEEVLISVYPNPSSQYINVEAENFKNIEILSLNGQSLTTAQLKNGTAKLNVSTMSPGIYLMSVHGDNGTITKRIQIL